MDEAALRAWMDERIEAAQQAAEAWRITAGLMEAARDRAVADRDQAIAERDEALELWKGEAEVANKYTRELYAAQAELDALTDASRAEGTVFNLAVRDLVAMRDRLVTERDQLRAVVTALLAWDRVDHIFSPPMGAPPPPDAEENALRQAVIDALDVVAGIGGTDD